MEEEAFLSQYDKWHTFPSFTRVNELLNPDPPRLCLFYRFQQMNEVRLVPFYGVLVQTEVCEEIKVRGELESYALRTLEPGRFARPAVNVGKE